MKVLLELTVDGKVPLKQIESVIDYSTTREALSEGLNKTVSLRLVDTGLMKKALLAFIYTIEATGGVRHDNNRLYRPSGDPNWIDLGDAYMLACKATGHKPMVKPIDDENE